MRISTGRIVAAWLETVVGVLFLAFAHTYDTETIRLVIAAVGGVALGMGVVMHCVNATDQKYL